MMQKFRTIQSLAVLGLFLLSGFSGCTIKATLDTTTDGTTEFLSSSTGKSWWTEDGLVKRGEHARAFVATNHDSLLQEIAQGHGEYVQALGTILDVPSHQQAHFQELIQNEYPVLVEIPIFLGDDQLNRFIGHARQAGIDSASSNL
ncbi:MAG TPA: DUF3015 family protein [Nitrospirales bacterium]|nr:hypothetical protein [Nitrospiraceae bacterium]HNP27608.1 DUF3015 family protein [Nitrospirales bacterium]